MESSFKQNIVWTFRLVYFVYYEEKDKGWRGRL